jgi:phytol kinase
MIVELIILIVAQILIFEVAKVVYESLQCNYIFTRKFVHIATGLVAVFTPLFVGRDTIILYAFLATVTLMFAKKKRLIDFVSKEDEDDFGLLLFPVAVALSAFLFWGESYLAYQYAMLMLTVPDSLAGISGRLFGRANKYLGRKTFMGMVTFFVSGLVVSVLFVILHKLTLSDYIVRITVASIIVAFVEVLSNDRLGDNITIPLSAGMIASVIF